MVTIMMMEWVSRALERRGTKNLRRNPELLPMFCMYDYGISDEHSAAPSQNMHSKYSSDAFAAGRSPSAFSNEDHPPTFYPASANPKVWSPPVAKTNEDYEKLAEIIHFNSDGEINGEDDGWASDEEKLNVGRGDDGDIDMFKNGEEFESRIVEEPQYIDDIED